MNNKIAAEESCGFVDLHDCFPSYFEFQFFSNFALV